jgi:hypothetical protein
MTPFPDLQGPGLWRFLNFCKKVFPISLGLRGVDSDTFCNFGDFIEILEGAILRIFGIKRKI